MKVGIDRNNQLFSVEFTSMTNTAHSQNFFMVNFMATLGLFFQKVMLHKGHHLAKVKNTFGQSKPWAKNIVVSL